MQKDTTDLSQTDNASTQQNQSTELTAKSLGLKSPKKGLVANKRFFFITLAVIQVVGVTILVTLLHKINQMQEGVSSGGLPLVAAAYFLVLIAFIVVVAVAIAASINLVGLLIYIFRHRPHGKTLFLSTASLLISTALFASGVYIVYGAGDTSQESLDERQTSIEKMQHELLLEKEAYNTDNANSDITKDEAIALLQACKLMGFHYTKETHEEHNTSPATSSTGIVLTKVDGEPYRINIADRLIDELVPIARDAQNRCGKPQFWRDGSFEHYTNGKWQFKGEDVDTGTSN